MATTTKKTTPAKKTTAPKTVVTKTITLDKQVEPAVAGETRLGRARFINKNLKVSPRKLRLLVNGIKKFDPLTAIAKLKFTNTNAARLLLKCLEDAVASAKHNYNLVPETLKYTDFRVDEGMKIKRMDKSHGSRFARGIIQKRHSRLTIILSGTIQG